MVCNKAGRMGREYFLKQKSVAFGICSVAEQWQPTMETAR